MAAVSAIRASLRLAGKFEIYADASLDAQKVMTG
jgi:hypothetical protein